MSRPIPYKELNEIRRIAGNSGLSFTAKLKAASAVVLSSGYLVLPIDVIPDAIPFVGTADDLAPWLILSGVAYKIWQESSQLKKENELLQYKLQNPHAQLPES